jgi:hypothetical protein
MMPVMGRLSPNLAYEVEDMLLRNVGLWCGIFNRKWKADAFLA